MVLLAFGISDLGNNITGSLKIFKINQETLRANSDIDWNDKDFDEQVVVYIVQPNVHKN